MKEYIRLLLLSVVMILGMTMMSAQTKDIVYLKNGSVIKGTILEMIPDKTIKIQTVDGNIFVYNMTEVEKISKEAAPPAGEPKPPVEHPGAEQQRNNESQRNIQGQESSEGVGAKFSIYGGVCLPVGDFAKTDGDNAGLAKTGWSAGVQLVTGGPVGLLFDGNYSQNKINLPAFTNGLPGQYSITGWTQILALGGIRIGTDNATGDNFFVAPLVGALFGTSPQLDYTSTGSFITTPLESSGKGTAVAYGGAVQLMFGGHVIIDAKYIMSKPK